MGIENNELRRFAEAMLDIERLKIVGELAKGNGRVGALAAQVGLPAERVAAHLKKLSRTGIVTRQKSAGEEAEYRLDAAALEEMSRRHFAGKRAQEAAEPDLRQIGAQFTKEEAKIIRSFTDPNGLIKHLPALNKQHKLVTILRYGMQGLEAGKVYSEKEINAALGQFTRDTSSLRRYLVDFGYLKRKSDGSKYSLVEGAAQPAQESGHA